MFERSQDLLSITMATRVGQERRYFTAMLILQTSGAESPIFHSESIAAYASPPVRGFPGVHRENSSFTPHRQGKNSKFKNLKS